MLNKYLFFSLMSAMSAWSQIQSPTVKIAITDGTTPPSLATGAPVGSYLTNDIEQINFYNGKLNLTIPLLEVGGRGEARYTINALAHQPAWTVRVDSFAQDAGSSSGGACNPLQTVCFHYQFISKPELERSEPMWQPGYGSGRLLVKKAADGLAPCFNGSTVSYYSLGIAFTHVVFVSPDGTEHSLYAADSGLSNRGCSTGPDGFGMFRGNVFKSRDGSGMTFIASASPATTAKLMDRHDPGAYPRESVQSAPDGVLYTKGGLKYVQTGGQIKSLADRNGNEITFTYKQVPITSGGTIDSNLVEDIRDSAGRTIRCDYDIPFTTGGVTYRADTIAYRTQDSVEPVIRVLKLPLTDVSVLANPADISVPLFPDHTTNASETYGAGAIQVLTGILLPHQALTENPAYRLKYTRYGEVATLQLPSGSFTKYTHSAGLDSTAAGVFPSGQVLSKLAGNKRTDGSALPYWKPFIYRRMIRKDVYDQENGGLNGWATYSRPETVTGSTPGGTVTDSVGLTTFIGLTSGASGPTVEVANGGQSVSVPVVERHTYYTRSDNCIDPGGVSCGPNQIVNFSRSLDGPAQSLFVAQPLRAFNDELEGKEFKTEWPGVRAIERVYGRVNFAALPCREDEVHFSTASLGSPLGSSIRKKTRTLYDAYENPSQVYQHPFTPGGSLPTGTDSLGASGPACPSAIESGWLRRTETAYQTAASYVDPPVHLRSLALTAKSFSPADSAGNPSAQTTLAYDGASLAPRSNPVNWTNPATSARGNLTSASSIVRQLPSGGLETPVNVSFLYDDLGNAVSATDARSQTMSYIYTDVFTSGSVLPPGTNSFAFRTETLFPNPSAASMPAPVKTKTEYDFYLGKPRRFYDINNVETDLSYKDTASDVYGRLRSVTVGNNLAGTRLKRKSTYTYGDTPGSLFVETRKDFRNSSDLGHFERATYDRLGRVTLAQSGLAQSVFSDEVFDGLGRTYQKRNPRFSTADPSTDGNTILTYDSAGRETQRSLPDSSTVLAKYDIDTANLALLTEMTEAGVKKRSVTDSLGRLVKIIEYPNRLDLNVIEETVYSYDVLDHLTSATQPGQPSRTFVYDSLGRLRSASNPESGTTTYQYDANGNLLTKSSPGFVTNIQYDNWNRPVLKTYSGGNTKSVALCYDGRQPNGTEQSGNAVCVGSVVTSQIGRLTGFGNLNSWTLANIDYLGQVAGWQQYTLKRDGNIQVSPSQSYTYWADGAVAQRVLPSGRAIVACYDDLGRATWLSKDRGEANCEQTTGTNLGVYAKDFQYAAHGGAKQWSLGNGLTETVAYNNRLQSIQMSLGAVWTLQNEYARPTVANNGNVWKQRLTIPGKPQIVTAYDYDGVNRLAVAEERPVDENAPVCDTANTATLSTDGRWCQKFGYDRWANRLLTAKAGVGQGSTPLEPPAFSAATNRIAGGNWTYNARGDIETDGEGKKQSYDAEGRLVAVCASSVTVANCSDINNWDVRYVYDGQGQRVRKDLSNGSSVLYEYDAQGGLVAEYGSTGTAGTQYFTVDHLGSTRVVTDALQAVVGRYDYEPFGGELLITSASWRNGVTGYAPVGGLAQRFTGKERDGETGLDYFGARYMSAAQGRFTSPDAPFADQFTANPQSWNLYSYTRNNPLKYVDPAGQSVRVCITGGTCFEVPDSDYPGLQPGNPGTVLPTFNFGRDEISIQPITCGGQFCGTATYVNDNPGITPVYFPIAELREQVAPYNPRNWMRNASRTTIKSSMKDAKDDLEKKRPLNVSQKIQDQMKQRGWTEQEIREALGAPGIPAQGKKGPATRHVHPTTGKSVVVDNATGEIFHVGGDGFKYD